MSNNTSSRLKRGIRHAIVLVAMVLVSPMILMAQLEKWLQWGEWWFVAFSEMLSQIPGRTGAALRLGYYRGTLNRCGFNVYFGFGTKINHRTAEIAQGVVIGSHCNIGTVTLGEGVLVGSRVCLLSGGRQHDHTGDNERLEHGAPYFVRIHIGPRTWLGEGAIVMADVGGRSTVAAGSVVFRPIPEGVMAMGNPARVVSRDFSVPAIPKDRADGQPIPSIVGAVSPKIDSP